MTPEKLEDFPPLPMAGERDMTQYAPTDDQIGEAMLWLARLREADDGTSKAFERWIAAHPAHAFAYAEAEALFAFSARPAKKAARHYHRHGPILARRRRWRAATAAALAACLVAALALPRLDYLTFLGADAIAKAGDLKTVRLADGSRVTLNTRSALDIDVTADHRHLKLRGGEAYFEVAKDARHPFTVDAGQARIRVLGTKFNIRIDDDQVIVGVTEGKVRVARASGGQAPLDLTPGQEAIVDVRATQKRALDEFASQAWRRREIVVRRTPLRVIVHELNRYRPAGIYILNSALGESRFSGVFRTDDPDDAVRTIERALNIRGYTLPTGQTFLY